MWWLRQTHEHSIWVTEGPRSKAEEGVTMAAGDGGGVWEVVAFVSGLKEKDVCQGFPGRQDCESKSTKMPGGSQDLLVVSTGGVEFHKVWTWTYD